MPKRYDFVLREFPKKKLKAQVNTGTIMVGYHGNLYTYRVTSILDGLTWDDETNKVALGRSRLYLKNIDSQLETMLYTDNPHAEVLGKIGEVLPMKLVEYYK